MSDQIPLNRALLAQFLPNPQLIRAFENLFNAVYITGASDLQDLLVDSQTAQMKAGEALEKLADVANLLASVLLQPAASQVVEPVYINPDVETIRSPDYAPQTAEVVQVPNYDVPQAPIASDIYTPPTALGGCAEQVYMQGSWTPTITATGGTITSTTLNAARYARIADVIHLNIGFTITNNGTGSGAISITLPFAAKASEIGCFREGAVNGKMGAIITSAGSSTALMVFYDNTYPGGTSFALTGNLTYRI